MFFLRTDVAGKSSIQGPAPLEDFLTAYSRGQLGDHCELIEALEFCLAETPQASPWRKIGTIFPEEIVMEGNSNAVSELDPSIQGLLIRLIIAQKTQREHIRGIARYLVFLSILIFTLLITILSK